MFELVSVLFCSSLKLSFGLVLDWFQTGLELVLTWFRLSFRLVFDLILNWFHTLF